MDFVIIVGTFVLLCIIIKVFFIPDKDKHWSLRPWTPEVEETMEFDLDRIDQARDYFEFRLDELKKLPEEERCYWAQAFVLQKLAELEAEQLLSLRSNK
jgi:hypothetical protein